MNARLAVLLLVAGCCATARGADDGMDRLDDALTMSTPDGAVRARFSGTVDLEGYHFSQPAPAFIDASGATLFNPRFTTFLDAQIGSRIYVFAQARVDRGFDPDDDSLRARLDEYALRLTPWTDGRLNVQIGKFATVVGNWISRHSSWENPFVTAPLPYENLTGIWDEVAARSGATVLFWAHVRPGPTPGVPAADKYLRLPIIWGPSYARGAAVTGELGRMNYAAEIKATSLSSRPSTWSEGEFHWRYPTVSARLGYRPNQMWQFGASASMGVYLQNLAVPTLPPGNGLGDYRQVVLGQDVAFAWHHLQVWAELYEARFEIPRVGNADTYAGYVEVKYKFTPQFYGALRWNAQLFAKIPDGFGGRERWGANLWRLDVAPGYRFTPHTQLKLQYSLQHDAISPREYSHLIAAQFVLRF